MDAEGSGYEYVYQYKDHLGNIRLTYADSDGDGKIDASEEIISENNYYPFGLKHKGYNNVINGADHPYGFGGMEEQNELGLGWIDITARNYNPELGRWMNLDPLAEQMRRHSPYNFGFNNPVFFQDPDGMMPCPTGDCENKKLMNTLNQIKGESINGVVSTVQLTQAILAFHPAVGGTVRKVSGTLRAINNQIIKKKEKRIESLNGELETLNKQKQKLQGEDVGYFGSICATDFGRLVPVVSV